MAAAVGAVENDAAIAAGMAGAVAARRDCQTAGRARRKADRAALVIIVLAPHTQCTLHEVLNSTIYFIVYSCKFLSFSPCVEPFCAHFFNYMGVRPIVEEVMRGCVV